MKEYVEGNYKVDSTKGKAKLMPLKYKGDINAQAWLDSRELATISNWLEGRGVRTRYVSELIRECVSLISSKLVNSGLERPVELSSDAHAILSARYGVRFDDRRGKRNRLHNSVLDCDAGVDSILDLGTQDDGWVDAVKKARERIDVEE